MRFHRWLLKLYPKSFRNEYGAELGAIFQRRLRDASGPAGRAGVWLSEFADVAANASRVHMDILRQDFKFSIRALRRSPGFFAAAVIVTSLGIGATTAAFTLTDYVLFRPLPYPDADALVKIWESNPRRNPGIRGLGGTNDVAPANYRDWKQQSTSFEEMGTYTPATASLVGRGEPERLTGTVVTPSALRAVGVQPVVGRLLQDSEDLENAACNVLISDELWRHKFSAGASPVGEKILLDDEPCAVVGVMPAGFAFPQRDTMFWRPIRFSEAQYQQRNNNWLRVVARLKAGVTVAHATADLKRIAAQLERQYPDENKDVSVAVITMRDEVSPNARMMIFAVAGAAGCLLLIACTNLASLLLARATSRSRELAVRTALGAGSERLVRQLLTDTAIIAIAGAALGVTVAIFAVPLAAKLVPTTLPVGPVPPADWRMLAVAAFGTLLTVMACGVAPAIRAARQTSAGALRDGPRTGSSRRTERLRGILVIAQVAASVALLVCTGLLLRALWRVQAIDPGFKTDNVLTMRLNLPPAEYAANAKRNAFYQRVLDDVEKLPNVGAAGFISFLPLTQQGGVWPIYRPGQAEVPGQNVQSSLIRFVTPRYFEVVGIPLIQGRTFDTRDSVTGEPAAVVSQKFGDKLWPGQSPIGQRFQMLGTVRVVIGIVGEIKARGLERDNETQVYLSAAQHPNSQYDRYVARDLVVRTPRALSGTESGVLSASIREIVNRADPRLAISDVRPFRDIVENNYAFRSVQADVLRAFAVVAIVLAAVGLHGLLAFMVSARTREIGVRIALGAARRDILSMVIGRGLRLAALGGIVGLGVGYFAGSSFRAVLAGVEPTDVTAIVGALSVAVVMTLMGSLWPAVRAARTDPMTATRAE